MATLTTIAVICFIGFLVVILSMASGGMIIFPIIDIIVLVLLFKFVGFIVKDKKKRNK